MKSALASDIDQLLAEQALQWPLLARGVQGLRESQTRVEKVAGRDVLVRHIPHRIKSTTAAVDAFSISQRACFLCPQNLDPEERGISFNSDLMLYCNPFPILENHLTIVHTEHRPQRIAGQFGALLSLAESLPGFFVIYNGPECGASAPDHFHFQACSRALFPIERDIQNLTTLSPENYLPRVFVMRAPDSKRLEGQLEDLIQTLAETTRSESEPMVNIAAFFRDGVFTALVFPRGRHRPRVFETKEFTVSPAAIDLCGIFVVPVKDDFDRIRGIHLEQILAEVTLPLDRFQTVLSRMGDRH